MLAANSRFRPPAQWSDAALGVSKELVHFQFVAMDKPTELDECVVTFGEPLHHDRQQCPSDFVPDDASAEPKTIRLQAARTPLDCLLAAVVQQMFPGEQSRVRIERRSGKPTIELLVHLHRIAANERPHLYQLSPAQLVAYASGQKENGVALFRLGDGGIRFAHYAFSRAAKALLSLRPFEKLADAEPEAAVSAAEVQQLLNAVSLNLAACLLRDERWEDALYALREVSEGAEAPDRAIYRRAMAHCRLGQLDEARQQIERLEWASNAQQYALQAEIRARQREYRSNYSDMVRKMFQ